MWDCWVITTRHTFTMKHCSLAKTLSNKTLISCQVISMHQILIDRPWCLISSGPCLRVAAKKALFERGNIMIFSLCCIIRLWHPDDADKCWASYLLNFSHLSKKKVWETSHQILKCFVAFQSFFVLDFYPSDFFIWAWILHLEYRAFFADFPFRVAVCKILWSLTFLME